MMHDKGYAVPEVLVSTSWVADNLENTSSVRFVESNEDVLLYSTGHIKNAVHIDWIADLNDAIRRDYLDESSFAQLLSKHGIGNDTTVVFYGDKNNWWACYAFWVFKLFGHVDMTGNPLLLLTIFSLMAGLQFFMSSGVKYGSIFFLFHEFLSMGRGMG